MLEQDRKQIIKKYFLNGRRGFPFPLQAWEEEVVRRPRAALQIFGHLFSEACREVCEGCTRGVPVQAESSSGRQAAAPVAQV